MPFYLKYDGVEGAVASRHSGGVNVLMGDGSVRGLSSSVSVGLSKVGTGSIVFNRSNSVSGGKVSVSDLSLGMGMKNTLDISRIILPNSPMEFEFLDAQDSTAESKARMMFEAQRSRVTSLTVVFNSAQHNKANLQNNLRQISLSGRRVLAMELFVTNGENSKGLQIELQDVLVSSYQVSGGAINIPSDSYTLNFTQVKIRHTESSK